MIITILGILLESIDSLMKGIKTLLESKDFTLGAILAVVAPFVWALNRIRKEKERIIRDRRIENRQLRIESKIDDLMLDRGVVSTWISPENGLMNEERMILKRLFSYLPKATKPRKRRMNMLMDILKTNVSKKLTALIVGAAVTTLNKKLGLDLTPNELMAFILSVITYIIAQSHVDGKKAQAVVKELKSSIPVDPNATYKDLFPTIKAVHEKVNILLEKAKLNDIDILAAYPQLLDLLNSFEHPEPIETIEEHET